MQERIPNLASTQLQNGNETCIEGYSPIISRDQIRISPQTSLSGLAIHPFQLNSEEDNDETRNHDEQILKEIEEFKASRSTPEASLPFVSPTILGDDEEAGKEEDEMDSIVKQNFFLYMWTCLEDLFGYEVISWMNNLEDNTLTPEDDVEVEEDHTEDRDENQTIDEEQQTRQILNVSSLHHDTSILKHLNRGINHVEKILQIHSFLLKYHLTANNSSSSSNETNEGGGGGTNIYNLYLQQKKKLFSFLRLEDNFNPSFNQKQWIFLSLLIIDAILCKKIFIDENFSTSLSIHVNEILQNWNNKFDAYAAGILGGAGAANEILDERQILNLRQFFTIEAEA